MLTLALRALADSGAVIRAQSRFYSTPAMPLGSGPDFVNAVVELEVAWTARDTLSKLHEIEARLGRRRKVRWGARVVDLDLLAVQDTILPDFATLRYWMQLPADQQAKLAPDQLILPHPRLHQRGFVLVPMADVAPDWVHPATGQTVMQMRDSLPPEDLASITPVQ